MLLHILLLVKHHYVRLVGQQLLVCLLLKVPLDLGPIILKCLQRCPIGNSNPYEAQIFAYTVLATLPFNVHSPSLQLTSCYYVLYCLGGTFGQSSAWVLSGEKETTHFMLLHRA